MIFFSLICDYFKLIIINLILFCIFIFSITFYFIFNLILIFYFIQKSNYFTIFISINFVIFFPIESYIPVLIITIKKKKINIKNINIYKNGIEFQLT